MSETVTEQGGLPSGATRLRTSEVTQAAGCRPSRIVLAHTVHGADPFVTWMEVLPDDGDPPYCTNGHYFSDRDNAEANFLARELRGY